LGVLGRGGWSRGLVEVCISLRIEVCFVVSGQKEWKLVKRHILKASGIEFDTRRLSYANFSNGA
jgi:hypothetical protein